MAGKLGTSVAAVGTPVLWHLEISHYNEKARWALDYKGIAHVRRAVTPGLQELTGATPARGPHGAGPGAERACDR